MSGKIINIAIDGPSGAGKSTIAKLLSAKLGIMYLDTGALYRAIGLMASRENWKEDDAFVAEQLKHVKVDFDYDKATGLQHVYLNGEDVTSEIRQNFVSEYGSKFSALPSVRAALLETQRRIARENSAILDGRDIGTCVLPNADCKIFLTASVDIRAERRYNELKAKGEEVSFESIKADIAERDHRDMTRAISPLKKADDAIKVQSDNLSIEEVVEFISKIIERKCQS